MSTFHDNADRWFAEEVLPHDSELRAWLRGRFPTLPDIDDLVQETYSRVIQRHSRTPLNPTKPFIFATARNLVHDHFRREKVVRFEPMMETDRLTVVEDAAGVPEAVAHQQELQLLRLAIQSLPTRCRQVLTLRKLYGLSQKQIAAQLGISEHTVESQVGQGMRRCAEFLARHGLP